MKKQCRLSELKLGTVAVINTINCNDAIKNRIFDFGIITNEKIKALYKSPFGDPTAYLVKNAVVALRNSDSYYIMVTPIIN